VPSSRHASGQAARRDHAGRTARLDSAALGRRGEDLASRHYQRLGFRILARNVRTRHGEIDLIAFDGSTLAFVEVKARRQQRRPSAERSLEPPLARLGGRQRRRLRRMAIAWLYGPGRPRLRAGTIRFDAVGVLLDAAGELVRLDQIEGAW
jgi:putative endonuclease